jgi:hypothetical protein
MRCEVDRLAERDAVWAKRDAEMNAALTDAEQQLAQLSAAAHAAPAAAAEVRVHSHPPAATTSAGRAEQPRGARLSSHGPCRLKAAALQSDEKVANRDTKTGTGP